VNFRSLSNPSSEGINVKREARAEKATQKKISSYENEILKFVK